jgi:hypothetical protein
MEADDSGAKTEFPRLRTREELREHHVARHDPPDKSAAVDRMSLMYIHPNFLLDPERLTFVRFENMGQDPTAFLRFKDGSSETLTGEAAVRLQERLNHSVEPPPAEGASGQRDSEPAGMPGPDRRPLRWRRSGRAPGAPNPR